MSGWARSQDPPTGVRFALLSRLVRELYGLGRSSVLVQRADAEPVVFVRVRSGRMLAVLVVHGDGGWAYLWDGGQWADADGTAMAARRIAEVTR